MQNSTDLKESDICRHTITDVENDDVTRNQLLGQKGLHLSIAHTGRRNGDDTQCIRQSHYASHPPPFLLQQICLIPDSVAFTVVSLLPCIFIYLSQAISPTYKHAHAHAHTHTHTLTETEQEAGCRKHI